MKWHRLVPCSQCGGRLKVRTIVRTDVLAELLEGKTDQREKLWVFECPTCKPPAWFPRVSFVYLSKIYSARTGRVVAQGMSLPEAIRYFNRYANGRHSYKTKQGKESES